MLSIATDYAESTGCAKMRLEEISKAGFTHIHWCHQWNTDFLYSRHEISAIKKWLSNSNLLLCDLHASDGKEKRWHSELEYERLSGVDLVINRMQMTAELGSDVIVMHSGGTYSNQLKKSLDELEKYSKQYNVKIACENTPGNCHVLHEIFRDYSPDYIGLCYDSGHGNMLPDNQGIEFLDKYKDRLISVHLHDNNGLEDEHKVLFSSTINWDKIAELIAKSSYIKPVSMEISRGNSGFGEDSESFLRHAITTGNKLTQMIKNYQ